ncbi:hypothetical protein M430DRAFT_32184 [Amorphotheca resinae ATCC 22711]|jgi:cell division protein FtsW (lipid II flippase)|uniref:Uncharacterized protein n=1 Tax=Amorphotheca resinae ATCC 22711 TaxID=857342 RepID=A0A2T3BDP9_AMORE|nr:hypothetical protein M430DRAFT_32184 [Amorphotheca resinae ATCC 22711]PSS27458.1 hypothetical protein M430DRAFT_32184 [Amorphotheca resinae ATCC 22711]
MDPACSVWSCDVLVLAGFVCFATRMLRYAADDADDDKRYGDMMMMTITTMMIMQRSKSHPL